MHMYLMLWFPAAFPPLSCKSLSDLSWVLYTAPNKFGELSCCSVLDLIATDMSSSSDNLLVGPRSDLIERLVKDEKTSVSRGPLIILASCGRRKPDT